jgi:hypothetical protein
LEFSSNPIPACRHSKPPEIEIRMIGKTADGKTSQELIEGKTTAASIH